jgi:hypothetical protein
MSAKFIPIRTVGTRWGARVRAVVLGATGVFPALFLSPATRAADSGPAEGIAFFESKIRPLLIERCHECHSAETKQKGGLDLSSRERFLAGGDSGPAVVPGKPEASLLITVTGYHGDLKMPPKGKLPSAEIEALQRWVREGAPWPEEAERTATSKPDRLSARQEEFRRWWAFQPIADPVPPDLEDDPQHGWARNEIDRFVLAGLRSQGLGPAPEADRRTWLRRVTYDLTGLPPTEEETAFFLADSSPQAHERVVDRLLASPAYGERVGRRWLDVARYADAYQAGRASHGSSSDFELTEAWRYRNWVVSALNRDLPFDRFMTRQIAGDLIRDPLDGAPADPASIDAAGLTATSFLSIGSWDHADADKEKLVGDIVDDQIETVGKAFLGLTLGCARCHDHKFDPVSTADYYALAGIFHSTRTLNALGKGGHSVLNRVRLVPPESARAYDEAAAALAGVTAKLAELDKRKPAVAADAPERLALKAERDRLQAAMPPKPPQAIAVQEGGVPKGLFPAIQDVPVHIRGSYNRFGPVVPRRMPAFFAGDKQPPISSGSGRKELAAWLASAENPLPRRVIVNRVWHWLLGRGIVPTPSNFGMRSESPSHPELLDWLASRFAAEGWSLKTLHRHIVLSATYRQNSVAAHAAMEADPENRWFGRAQPRRLDAEEIRDSMLIAAARLPSPAGEAGTGGPADHDLEARRRSLYVQTTRWDRANFSTLFDAANPDTSSESRPVSTVSPQALFLMNNRFVESVARDITTRLFGEVPAAAESDVPRLAQTWSVLLGRPPREEEVATARASLAAAPPGDPQAAWADLVHILLCSNEFAFLD